MKNQPNQPVLPFAHQVHRDCGELPIDQEFDVGLANRLAESESYNKHLYRPNAYLHKWWARRCGSTFRLILKHLIPDKQYRDYYSPGGLEGTVVLDPMMGGGTTVHEAIRLGANVLGADIDPIPVLQARAALTHIPLEKLELAFQDFFDAIGTDVRPYFQASCPICKREAEVRYVLHGQRRVCRCGESLFVDSLVLREETGGGATVLCPKCGGIHGDGVDCTCEEKVLDRPVRVKGTRACSDCGLSFGELLEEPFYLRYDPVAILIGCPEHGSVFSSPSELESRQVQEANRIRGTLEFEPLEGFAVNPGPKSKDLVRREIHSYTDVFSSRQLIYLCAAQKALSALPADIRLNFALLVSTSLEFNSMLCGYKGSGRNRPGAIRHAFSHHAYSFPYTALENNPVFPLAQSGTLQKLFHDRIRRARQWASCPRERLFSETGSRFVHVTGEVGLGEEVTSPEELHSGSRKFHLIHGSSASLPVGDGEVDFVVTDPPYFDSVQYSDLSHFFRVWLSWLLPDAVTWNYCMTGSAVGMNGANDTSQYQAVLTGIFSESRRVLKKDSGRVIFTFHHWNPKGWSALTLALKSAGLRLVNSYVVHSENPVSVHIANLKSLKHDAVLVLAPGNEESRAKWHSMAEVRSDDSGHFSADCASTLGWLLESNMDDAAIAAEWERLLA